MTMETEPRSGSVVGGRRSSAVLLESCSSIAPTRPADSLPVGLGPALAGSVSVSPSGAGSGGGSAGVSGTVEPSRFGRRDAGAERQPVARSWARIVAGPVLIVTSVLVVLHAVAFSRSFSPQLNDVLAWWLPNFCFLGKSLAAGHIPAWNPHVMAGIPFAAEPQSGWMSMLPMALFSALPCGIALRWFLVIQPILAGLGLYWFLRSEGISRSGATVGGLTVSLALAGSLLVGAPYFTGSAAWTALSLAAASRCVRSAGWAARLVWMALTAVAWGQLAASHFSSGLVVGSAALAVYLIGTVASRVRARLMTRTEGALIVLLLGLSLPLVNLAYLLPRLEYLPRTTLGLGYAQLDALSRRLSQGRAGAYALDTFGGRAGPTWLLRLALSPGLYIGAIALLLLLASWWTSRKHLVLIFSAFGAFCYLLSLARPSDKALLGSSTLVSFYLHAPFRFSLGVL